MAAFIIMNAPIAIFAYNRPIHLARLLDSLTRCDGFANSPLIAFVDGPRSSADIELVHETRRILHKKLGSKVEIRAHNNNNGLSKQIISGVSDILRSYDTVIVLEDDLVVSPTFLSFLNDALGYFENNETVAQVSGFTFDVPQIASRKEAVLLPFTTTWGWATWKRAWQNADWNMSSAEVLMGDKLLQRRFDLHGAYSYTKMLKAQCAGRVDSWGIRWYWHVFYTGGLVCFPPQTLVRNLGMDGSGTHGRALSRFYGKYRRASLKPLNFSPPLEVGVNNAIWNAFKTSVWKASGGWVGYAFLALKHLSAAAGMCSKPRKVN